MNGFQSKRIDLSEIFHDPDGDTLKYEIQVSNKGVIIPEIHNNELLIIEDEPGITRLTLRAKDGRGGLSETQIQIIVSTDKNNPPYLSGSISNRVVFQGFERQDISLADLFTDLEGDQITYSLQVVNTARGWQRTFIFYGTAAILFFLIAFKGTHERVKLPKTQKSSIKKDLYELITNVPWLILLATTITFILFVAVRSSVTAHYFKYVIGSQNVSLPFIKTKTYSFETLVSAFNTMGQIASLIGVALVSWFAKQVGKKRAFIIIFLVAIFSTGAFYFLSAEQIGLIFFFQITGSLTGGPLSVLLWAMYADTADYAEWKRGRRATGLVFSASTMSQKFGWAFGAFVALNLMSQVGFQANKAQTPESLKGLILLFSLIPAGMGVLSVIISFFYPLNEKHVKEIGTELESRRKKE
ncbi:MFS transporter [bacterium]|nr:MFS transporter [bacterium]